jgi:hypothetical protein
MRLSLEDAALRLGLSSKTVRRYVKLGKLQGTQVPTSRGFQWMIELPDEEPVETTESAQMQDLRNVNQFLMSQLQTRDKQIEQLHILLQQAQAALPSPVHRSWWRFWSRDSA